MGKHNLKRPSPVVRWGFQGWDMCAFKEFWPRLSSGNSQRTQTIAKTKDCSLKTDTRAPLPRTAYTQLMEYSTLCHSFLGAGCYSPIHLNRNVHTNPSLKPLTCDPFNLQNMLGLWWHSTYGSSPPMSDLIYGLLYENKSSPYTAWVTRNRRQDSLISNANLNITGLKNKQKIN